MIKLPRKFKNITHTAIAIVDDAQDNTKANIAKFVAINVGVVAAVVAAKYAVSEMLSDSDN